MLAVDITVPSRIREPALDHTPVLQVGRYSIFGPLAAGGMATVHLAKLVGSAGFSRVVAAKRMHRDLLLDPECKEMFLDEARLAARVSHPNVVPVLDVISHENELFIVMDYVHGAALHVLLRMAKDGNQPIPVKIGCAVVAEALHGLHAAHEARDEKGAPLDIVHRDVSPQNIIVGSDGVARVLDFGIAKAIYGYHQTNPGTLKGKLAYMAPEVIRGAEVTRQVDVFSAGVVFWEVLTGQRLFGDPSDEMRKLSILSGKYPSVREVNPKVSAALDLVVKKALELDTRFRYRTALEFAIDVERAISVSSHRVVSEWVRRLAAGTLQQRAALIQEIESLDTPRHPSAPPARPATATGAATSFKESGIELRRQPPPRLRSQIRSATAVALTTALVIGTLTYMLTRSRGVAQNVSPLGGANSGQTATSAVLGSARFERPAQDLGPVTITESASESGIRVSSGVPSSDKPTGPQPKARRAVMVRRTPSHSTPHGKTYLPDKL